MSRLSIENPGRAQTVLGGLNRDMERRISASPAGLCPVDMSLNFLRLCHAQTCGKCVPCRVGLGQLSSLIEQVLDRTATIETIDLIENTAQVIADSADCAIGYEAAHMVLKGVRGFREDYEEHVLHGRCICGLSHPVPCVSACPAHVDVPGYISLIRDERYDDAVRLIRKDNPFPSACAYVCEHPCEAQCRRRMVDDAINICGLKRFAVDNAAPVHPMMKAEGTGKTVAVIGGGPGGLTAAYYLSLMGHKVTVYEQRPKLGGMLRYGIPDYRLPQEVLDRDIAHILSTGIKVHTGVSIGKDLPMENIQKSFDAVYISIGAHADKKLGLEGEDAQNVVSAVELLRGVGEGHSPDFTGKRVIKDSDCALCGQCITHCPVGGLRERDDTQKAFAALADPEKITVVQVAPAVRAAWGEALGLKREEATMERMAATLRRLGFDYIFDTNFTADLTIMEEGNEFLHRLKAGGLERWPMFTSCCPGWVRFLKSQYPELVGQLSSAKSPQQMFGSVTKSWFAQKLGVPAEKIFCVSIMPCVAKKAEAELPTMATEAGPDVDLVLTTRELVRMVRADKIDPATLPEEKTDDPMGIHTGAGVIFGATGGVMEAALRTAAFVLTGENPQPDAFEAVRTGPGLREVTYEVAGIPVRCAVVSGLGNARKLIEQLKAGKAHYDFVEVMACPGGCVGGGGQPISCEDEELYGVRGQRLYQLDRDNPIRFSHENPAVQTLYSEFLGAPLSHRSEQLLHTDHHGWKMPNEN